MLRLPEKPKPLVMLILDGWGVAQDSIGNAITRANLKNFNDLWYSFPHATLSSAGQSVGLPEGQVGNSEVGHLNLGAGRIVFQDLLRINMSIADGTFFENAAFKEAVDHVKKNGSKIHLMGLVGLGSVHSEAEHLYALLSFIARQGIAQARVKLHLFTDGRDSPPTSARFYLNEIKSKIASLGVGQIATISGRYFAMDRDNRWDRIEKAYNAICGMGQNTEKDPIDAVEKSYGEGKTDEFIEPVIIVDESQVPVGPVSAGDAVIFLNYRPDRARQLTKAFVLEDLTEQKASSDEKISTFQRGGKIKNLFFVSMTRYEKNLPVNKIAYEPEEVEMPISRVFSELGSKQLHIAETEKYAHVTYFFNGGREQVFPWEDRILINSPKVASYDQKPEMSTPEITKTLISKVNTNLYDFIVCNFANADMVAHTGKLDATIKAVQVIDSFLGDIIRLIFARGGGVLITSDHGNAEEMINLRTGEIDTEHNINPSPCIFAFEKLRGQNTQFPQGLLADVAPSVLSLMQIPKPQQMTGRSLL